MGPLPRKKSVNQKIKECLSNVYGDTWTALHNESLNARIECARKLINKKRKPHWDERDVVLITYADQFHSENEKPLPAFNQFWKRWFSSVFSHVHLLPFYPWSSDDGFSVIDYYQVAPETGEWNDILDLNMSCRLMFDFVCNHMSAKSDWFNRYLQQAPGYENFFIEMEPTTDLHAVTRPRALPLLTPFTLQDKSVRHLWTTFSEDQVDLNYSNPDVLLAMIDVLLTYLERGADYVRLDAVGYMWKTPGTTCIHLEKTHQLIKLFRAIADEVAPGTVIITETNVPHKDNVSYLGNGHDEAHMVYQFSLPPLVLHTLHRQDCRALCQWAQSLTLPSNDTTWFNFLASHDGIGLNPLRGLLAEEDILTLVTVLQKEGALVNWKNNSDGTRSPYELNVTWMDALSHQDDGDDDRLAKFILTHVLLLTFPGVPAIYIQSILGSRNDYEGVEIQGYNRAINRKKYQRHAIDAELMVEDSLRHNVYQMLSRLIVIRRGNKAFHPESAFDIYSLTPSVLRIIRSADERETINAFFNFSDRIQIIDAGIYTGTDLISGINVSGETLTLQPWQAMWIKR
ncbi:TPA: sugar phosphorylase [Citrobacter amalonaticus]